MDRHGSSTKRQIITQARRVLDPWNPAVAKEIKIVAKAHVNHMLAIARASNLEQARGRFQHAIHASSCRLASAIMCWDGPKRSLRYFGEVVDRANIRKSQSERVFVHGIQKGDGKYRAINTYGHLDATKQTLLREVLLAKFGYSQHEYARSGRGRDAVIRETLRSIDNGEVKNLIEADIENFFPSVRREAISGILGLPKSVVRNTVGIGQNTNIIIRNKHDIHISEKQVRAGLPLGSRVTPLIASLLIEPVLDQFDGPITRSYIDNIGLGAINATEAAAKKDALAVLLAQHPAGPFTLKYCKSFTIYEPNDVLGYWVRAQEDNYPGVARVTPSIEAMTRGQRKFARRLVFIQNWRERDAAAEQWAIQWANTFGAWRGRANGQTNAVMAATNYVLPYCLNFWPMMRGNRFSSFSALIDAVDSYANLLPPDPDYRLPMLKPK